MTELIVVETVENPEIPTTPTTPKNGEKESFSSFLKLFWPTGFIGFGGPQARKLQFSKAHPNHLIISPSPRCRLNAFNFR